MNSFGKLFLCILSTSTFHTSFGADDQPPPWYQPYWDTVAGGLDNIAGYLGYQQPVQAQQAISQRIKEKYAQEIDNLKKRYKEAQLSKEDTQLFWDIYETVRPIATSDLRLELTQQEKKELQKAIATLNTHNIPNEGTSPLVLTKNILAYVLADTPKTQNNRENIRPIINITHYNAQANRTNKNPDRYLLNVWFNKLDTIKGPPLIKGTRKN